MSLIRSSFPCLILALAGSLTVACGYGDHHDGDYYSPPGVIEQATIDTDQLLDVEAGEGAGAFIEYESGGTYHVTTTCDLAGEHACVWDIVVTPLDGARVLSLTSADLESDDTVSLSTDDRVRLVARTGTDFDGFSFTTEPGAAIEVDALLDDGAGNRFLFWVGDGAVHGGAPTNPIDLIPSAE
jgi:hypothetical protein